MISRVCEEFHCLPSEAARELDRCEALVFAVLEMRTYAQTKQAIDDAEASDGQRDAPKGPMADMVYEIEYDIYKAREALLTSVD